MWKNAEFVAQDATAHEGACSIGGASAALVLLMDPPRAGSTPEFLAGARRLPRAHRLASRATPATQARDVRQLVKSGYEVRAIRPVDMFPHTDT